MANRYFKEINKTIDKPIVNRTTKQSPRSCKVYQTMSGKSKQYIINTEKIIELLAREVIAKDARPLTRDWVVASGIPSKTFYTKLNKKIKELKEKAK